MIFNKVVVTGGAGFLGSHLVDAILARGIASRITIVDNLSSGSIENVKSSLADPRVEFAKLDLKELNNDLVQAFRGADVVFHYAANPEVRVSVTEPRTHFDENIVATFNVLELCRKLDIDYIVFASSSTVYGDSMVLPTPETYCLMQPISFYGAAKLCCEVMISTYASLYGLRALILRYANIVGPRLRHGVIYDFIQKLMKNPRRLEILGDGSQRKSYLHVSDAVDATLHLLNTMIERGRRVEVFNVGNSDWITVREIADIVVEEMGLQGVEYVFRPATSDGRGWLGDVKFMLLDITKLVSTGWRPRMSSREAVRRCARELLKELGFARSSS